MADTPPSIDLASQTGQEAIAAAIAGLSNLRVNIENVDQDWERIASNALTASWKQNPQSIIFLLSYDTEFCLQAVFINTSGNLVSATIVTSTNYGTPPTLTFDSTTNTVTATWPTNSYAKIKR